MLFLNNPYLRAFVTSQKYHKHQLYDNNPYFSYHILGVMFKAGDIGITNIYVIVTILLHDILEDTAYTREQLLADFGVNFYNHVVAITRNKGESYKNYIVRCAMDEIARQAKIFDLLFNIEHCIGKSDKKRLFKRYTWALNYLANTESK